MTNENKMKVEFLNKSTNESFARVVVAAFVSQLDPTVEELADIKTAVSEAVTNSIIHGYKNTEGFVEIECEIKDNTVKIIVSDKGKGIEDIQKARQPLFTTQPEMERSGMGFTVMETFMDEVSVISEYNKGTKIIMTKKVKSG